MRKNPLHVRRESVFEQHLCVETFIRNHCKSFNWKNGFRMDLCHPPTWFYIQILNVFVRIVSFPLCYYNQHAMTSALMCLYMSVSNQTTNYGIFTFRNSFFLSTRSWKKVSTCVFLYISYYKILSQKQIYNVLLHILVDGMRCLWKKNLSAQVFCNANIHVFRTN